MELKIEECICLFKMINDLKKLYGYEIIKRTKIFLENTVENKLSFFDKEIWILNFFYKLGIRDINEILSFWDSILDIYRYDSIIKWLESLKEELGVDKVCLNVSKDGVINIDSKTLKKVYGNVYTYYSFDNENKDFNLVVRGLEPFIVLDILNEEKVLYLDDFRINCLISLDNFDLMEEKCKLLWELLSCIKNQRVDLIIGNVDLEGEYIIKSDSLNIFYDKDLDIIKIVISEEFYKYINSGENKELIDLISELLVIKRKRIM